MFNHKVEQVGDTFISMLSFNDNMNVEQTLYDCGLNEREVRTYLALLKLDTATASHIAKIAKINRTTAYLELENLLDKGLVSYSIKENKRFYKAASPKKLVEYIDNKKQRVEQILPSLNQLQSPKTHTNALTYEGKEGIRTFYLDVLESAEDFFVLGATGKALEALKFEYPHVMKQFEKTKITEYALANLSAKKSMQQHPKNVKTRYLPKTMRAEVTTVIYAGKVAFHSLQEDNFYVVIIEDEALNRTYKQLFDWLWNICR